MLDRWVEDGLLTTLDDLGVGSIAYSPLEQGILSDRYLKGIPAGSRAAGSSPFLTPESVTPSWSPDCARSTWSPPSAGRPWRRWRWPGCCEAGV